MELKEARKMRRALLLKGIFLEFAQRFEDAKENEKNFVDDEKEQIEVKFEIAADETIHGDFKGVLHGMAYAGCGFWGQVSLIKKGRWLVLGCINVNELGRFKELVYEINVII